MSKFERRRMSLDMTMGTIMKMSYIDRDTEEHLAAATLGSLDGISASKHILQIAKIRGLPRSKRHAISQKHLLPLREDRDLYLARKVRNGIAHAIDTATPHGAHGTHGPQTKYSTTDLRKALDAADRYMLRAKSLFMQNSHYRLWQEGRPRSDAYPGA